MCRLPEEGVKGHSGAIYTGPPLLFTKYQGSSRLYIALYKPDMPQAGPHFILGA